MKHILLWLIVFCSLFVLSPVAAQQPTATISGIEGRVSILRPGREAAQGREGMVLNMEDSIETKPGAGVLLALSDGSTIAVDEKTRIDLAILLGTPVTGRKSRIKLLYGRFRAWLSPDHQKGDAQFDIETPNAQVGVKFSQPDVEMQYDPEAKETRVWAYTININVLNLLTGARITEMPKEHQAIVKDDYIAVIKMSETPPPINIERKRSEKSAPGEKDDDTDEGKLTDEMVVTRVDLLQGRHETVTASISATPGSASGPVTSQAPSGGARPTRPEEQLVPVGFTFTLTEE